jgi:uncharacterized protein YecE (DUF72 family)
VNRGKFFTGTSGWSYQHWRGLFYPIDLPQREWFAHYARHFQSVEINYTFYRLPSAKTFVRWREHSPPQFVYALKAPRTITHLRKLQRCEDSLEAFVERARLLGDKLGPILYQLPPRWGCNVQRLADFVELLPGDLCHVFEFRDQSWHVAPVLELLRSRDLGFCYIDLPGFECPSLVTGRVFYARMHGVGVKYGGSYDEGRLLELAERVCHLRDEGYDTFAYFNNDAEAHAVENAWDLRLQVDDLMRRDHA